MAGDKKKRSSRKWVQRTESILSNKWVTLVLVLIPIFCAIWFRAYPAYLPITDDWAEESIRSSYIGQIENQIRQDFPLLPAEQARTRANELWGEYRSQNHAQVEAQKAQLSQQFKSRLQQTVTKPNGDTYEQTYLLAIDPYIQLRRSENFVENGYACEEVIDGVCTDTLRNAPFGSATSTSLHAVVAGVLITIAGWFGFNSMSGVFFLPAIFAALATVPIFFLVKRRYGAFAGLVAAFIVAVHVTFLSRTPAGFVDTDVWNVFFPSLIIWLFLLGEEYKGKMTYVFMGLAGIATGIYARFWSGWFFTFIILLAVLVGTIVLALLRVYLRTNKKNKKKRKELFGKVKHTALLLLIYFIPTAVLIMILVSPTAVLGALQSPLSFSLDLQDPINANLWPNVLTTVAELNQVSIPNIIGQLGGRLMFVLAVFGIFTFALNPKKMKTTDWGIAGGILIYYTILTSQSALAFATRAVPIQLLFLSVNPAIFYLGLFMIPLAGILLYIIFTDKEVNINYGLLTMAWFVASIFATTQGTRFLLLLVPIFGITVGFMAGWLKEAFGRISHHIDIPAFWGRAIAVVFIIFILLAPVAGNFLGRAESVAGREVPSMNDAWWSALTAIKEQSSEDAIITSWWDFGHWFTYIADRRVSFDGAGQNNPKAHWVGKMLQTDDEGEAIGILRMIDCGSNRAFETIQGHTENTLDSYALTRNIIDTSRADAEATLLAAGLPQATVDQTLEYSHCIPPEAFVIVSEDMVGKAGVWAHFGLWDFDKAFVYSAFKTLPREQAITRIQEELELPAGEAAQLYGTVASLPSENHINRWISPFAGYAGRASCERSNSSIMCNVGVRVSEQQGVPIIAHQLFVDTNNVSNSTITLAANGQIVGEIKPRSMIIDGEEYFIGGDFSMGMEISGERLQLSSEELLGSQFAKWFYDEDPGSYLVEVAKERQITGGKIIVYKVDWDKYIGELEQ